MLKTQGMEITIMRIIKEKGKQSKHRSKKESKY